MPIALPSDLHWTAWADFQAEAYTTLCGWGWRPVSGGAGVLQALPNGGALIDLVKGRLPALPADLRRLAHFLADMHQMPVPMPEMRGLPSFDNALQRVAQLISDQGRYVKDAPVSEGVRTALEDELVWLADFAKSGWVRLPPPWPLAGRIHLGDFPTIRKGGDADRRKPSPRPADARCRGAVDLSAMVGDMSLQAELSEDDAGLSRRLPRCARFPPAGAKPAMAGPGAADRDAARDLVLHVAGPHRRPGISGGPTPAGIIAHQRGLR